MPELLIVDDDVTVLRQVQSCLGDLANLRVARTGRDATRLCRQARPDLLMLDLDLGDTDGLAVLAALRSDPALATIPVIFLSGEQDSAPRVRALEQDVLDWLTKPLDEARLRARVQAALRRAPSASLTAAEPQGNISLHGARVLAVDDDLNVLDALRSTLGDEGFEFATATTGAEALRHVTIRPPELVLVDIGMSGIDGFQLAQQMMATPSMADVPIIFVTQHGDVASEVRAFELGAFDFVSKPFVAAVLRARVSNALRLRRRSMRALQRAQERWRRISGAQLSAIVANAHDAIVTLDDDGRIALANEASHRLLGGSGAPVANSTLPPWLLSALPAQLLDGTQARASNVTLTVPDHTAATFDVSSSVDGSSEHRLVTLTFHDQTPRLEAEALAREQVRLQAESRTKQLMMSYLAHEIGNPLNGIIGLTGLLLSPGPDPLSPEQRHKLELIGESADVLRRLMSDALDLAQWECGRFAVELAPMPLRPAIEHSIGEVLPAARKAGIVISGPTGLRDPVVKADAVRVRQCLHNLLSNACKYGRAGGRVQIDVQADERDVTVAVSDDGPGMSAAQLERLFEPFERLGRSGRSGHGLGLAITRVLALAMKGRLEVSSEQGRGSRFALVLPRPAGHAEGAVNG